MPWQTEARKSAKKEGQPVPRGDLGALAMIVMAAMLVIGGTFAWDVLRFR
jgi:hypothetical protein